MENENNYVETDLGNIAPNPKGPYDNDTEYENLDLVEYMGSSYLCTVDLDKTISGIPPVDGETSEYWQLSAKRGESATSTGMGITEEELNRILI